MKPDEFIVVLFSASCDVSCNYAINVVGLHYIGRTFLTAEVMGVSNRLSDVKP
jgi:hypothetical protein